MPRYKSDINELLKEPEARAIYNKAKNQREQTLVSLCWLTGARTSEILELRKEHITIFPNSVKFIFQTKKLHADKQNFTLKERQLEFNRPEGNEMNIYIETIVQYVQTLQPETRLLDYTNRWAEKTLNRLGTESLGKPITPYHFRHSACTREFANGRTMDQVKHFKGAKSMRSVEPYAHESPYKVSVSSEAKP